MSGRDDILDQLRRSLGRDTTGVGGPGEDAAVQAVDQRLAASKATPSEVSIWYEPTMIPDGVARGALLV